ncbi:MAG: dihydrodipicolinate synthase family protein [Mesorhizobium sp.]|uniref:dihydrodipicolinate synthase family protein n=1 Tax=Mesorhizobium sp. TaxID=1871066 RepID=UPI000FEA60A2|nr:dihydrodipicolinate synthase family protein [Mesorhizobium sp.]RWI47918.1 MAG: dihydrodipicolinate synthase family protein [Mesorhizobium sp.]TJV29050.1 MAG: dihydrodipicolinate synthase family protein [Mesorhizobium sp.]TJW49900.1 MAG: dihydrodipicolinate synthase family protein [Mesorhizobium sp.]
MQFPEMRGIVTVLNTPFTDDDRVDFQALQRHTEFAIKSGVAGFLVPANAAEVQSLRGTERDDMVAAVLEVSRKRAVVVGGASAPTHAERCRNSERLAKLGSDVILVSQPYENAGQYLTELQDVAAVAALPLMVQDWDANGTGVPLASLVEACSAIPQVRYLKIETVDAGPKYTALKRATKGDVHVSGGWTVMQLIEALDRGVDAFMPTSLHRIYVSIYKLYTAGNRDAATELFRRALPILAFSNQHLEHSIHFFKRLLWKQDIYPTPKLRAPVHAFDDHHRRMADELIELALTLDGELEVNAIL